MWRDICWALVNVAESAVWASMERDIWWPLAKVPLWAVSRSYRKGHLVDNGESCGMGSNVRLCRGTFRGH